MPAIPEFPDTQLEEICEVLADTQAGLTGSEIGRVLARLDIADPLPNITKRHRLFQALSDHQERSHSGNIVAAFMQEVMNPARYTSNPAVFNSRRDQLNTILAFCGYSLGEDRKLRLRNQQARTLTQAEEAFHSLLNKLSKKRRYPSLIS